MVLLVDHLLQTSDSVQTADLVRPTAFWKVRSTETCLRNSFWSGLAVKAAVCRLLNSTAFARRSFDSQKRQSLAWEALWRANRVSWRWLWRRSWHQVAGTQKVGGTSYQPVHQRWYGRCCISSAYIIRLHEGSACAGQAVRWLDYLCSLYVAEKHLVDPGWLSVFKSLRSCGLLAPTKPDHLVEHSSWKLRGSSLQPLIGHGGCFAVFRTYMNLLPNFATLPFILPFLVLLRSCLLRLVLLRVPLFPPKSGGHRISQNHSDSSQDVAVTYEAWSPARRHTCS